MTDIILLEGPDGFKYKGTQISEGVWNVESYLNWKNSKWWEKQCSFIYWRMTKKYTTAELKETFTILAASETYIEPRPEVVTHWD
jgi:hypothetical protein